MQDARSALIVATDAYTDPGLTTLQAPGHDAVALADVLGDPRIGGFDVETALNQPSYEITRAIARFFANRRPDDLLLLHVSCHGVKDDTGELYFATSDTTLDLLEATAVSSAFVNRAMTRSRAGRILLLLDCCYSGAFGRGLTARAGSAVDVNERLGGRGRAVITASSALQYAFEGERLSEGSLDAGRPSVFTRALVRGLGTGEADRDLDGWVSLDELYAYVHDEVTRVAPEQTPKKFVLDVEGDMYVARRATAVTTPSELPREIRETMDSLVPWERASAVEPLHLLVGGDHPGLALAARLALETLAHDDSDAVKAAARRVLAEVPPTPTVDPGPDRVAVERPPDVERPVDEPPVEEPPVEEPPVEEPPVDEPPVDDSTVDERVPATLVLEPGPGSGGSRWRRPRVLVPSVVLLLVAAGLGAWRAVDESRARGGGAGSSAIAPDEVVAAGQVGDVPGLVAIHTTARLDAGVDRVRMVLPGADIRGPNVSPDRTQVAFVQGARDAGEPRILRVGDPRSAPLVAAQDRPRCPASGRPAFSPDGRSAALVCLDQGRPTGLYTVDVATGRLTGPVVAGHRFLTGVTWTHDGDLVFLRGDPDAKGPSTLWQVPAAGGSDPSRIPVGGPGLRVGQPDASATGHSIMFVQTPAQGGDGRVMVWDGTTAQAQPSVGNAWVAGWSPDGTAYFFVTAPAGAGNDTLYVVRDGQTSDLVSGAFGPPSWGTR